jgi:hypothetical protein
MVSVDDIRLLAYSVDLGHVRAIELGRGLRQEHDFGPSVALLDGYDAVQRELSSSSLLSRSGLEALERFAAGWGRELLPRTWLSDPPQYAVLIPHALLHGLPLHVIRTDSGRPLCADTGVSICSSLTLLHRCLQRSPDLVGPRADPFLDGVESSPWLVAGADVLGSDDDAWRELPARLLAACGEDVEIEEATSPVASLRMMVERSLCGRVYELIIIAAHGYRDPLDALSSGLVLREPQLGGLMRSLQVMGNSHDPRGVPFLRHDLPVRELPAELMPTLPAELLSLAELEHAGHIVCPLVALLGCSAGRAIVYPGDQPMSMAEVLLRLGAAAVLAPMWDVTVTAVESWMQEFLLAYRRDRTSRGEAARRASRSRYDAGAPLHECGCLALRGDYR